MAITITSQPATLLPAYNPIVFKFNSTNNTQPGFRYLVDVYRSDDNSLINRLTLVPQADGTGYVDISKILSNEVDYTFNPLIPFDHSANGSFLNYYVKIGEEFSRTWPFTSITKNSTATYTGLTNLVNAASAYTYEAGDFINITTTSTTINGLHQVLFTSTSPNFVTIDVKYPFTVGTSSGVTGVTSYADGRKTQFPSLTATSASTTAVYNGAMEWFEWRTHIPTDFINTYSGFNAEKKLLTDLKHLGIQFNQSDRVYATISQAFWLNMFTLSGGPTATWYTNVTLFNQNGTIKYTDSQPWTISGPFGRLKQFKVGFTAFGFAPSQLEAGDYVDFKLSGGNGVQQSTTYRLYYDDRCRREVTELYWLDSKGSILSQAFPNKEVYSIDVTKESYKTAQIFGLPASLDTTIPMDKTSSVDYKQSFTLTTNWITEAQVELLAGMVASPYVWYFKGNNFDFQPVEVKEKSYEVTYQRNKKLIQKTFTVQWSNQTPINI